MSRPSCPAYDSPASAAMATSAPRHCQAGPGSGRAPVTAGPELARWVLRLSAMPPLCPGGPRASSAHGTKSGMKPSSTQGRPAPASPWPTGVTCRAPVTFGRLRSQRIFARVEEVRAVAGDEAGVPENGPINLSRLNTGVPHPARVYDVWLGGKNNFAADRAAAEAGLQAFPSTIKSVRANRAF